jgi:hypothetical protein
MPAVPGPTNPPRIVFFGPPHAGKTALLSAFLRLSNAVPLTPADSSRREIIPHVLPNAPAAPAGCVLIDTDGKTAASLIADPTRFRPRRIRREETDLSSAVYAADALVLLIDASADDAELDQLFRDFGRFLETLEETRTAEREVGGLPVYLTLTKCDALWQAGDTLADWQARIAARQREVQARFEDYLADAAGPAGPFAFGSIEVRVAATALNVPDALAKDSHRGPFGVMDLYRNSMMSARAFRRRSEQSARRLRWTIAGAGAIIGAIATTLAILLAFPVTDVEDVLANRIFAFQDRAGPPAVRLADRNFARNLAELTAIRETIGFDRLPQSLRQYVEEQLREFATYGDYRERFRPPRLSPNDVRSQAELDRLEAALTAELVPPSEYAIAWADTEAVRLWEKWKTDVALLRGAEELLYEWYRGLLRRATGLQLVPSVDYRWRQDVVALIESAETPPFRPDEPIPGSPRVPVRGGAVLTHAPAFQFDRVAIARQDWENEKQRLLHLRSLTDALGLTTGPDTPPPVLDLSEPTADLDQSRTVPGQTLQALRAEYPSPTEDYREWTVGRVPDPLRGVLQQRLDRVFQTAARHARRLILDRLGPAAGQETYADWQPLAAWLETDPVMAQWGELLGLIRRMADRDHGGDPVRELAAFLRQEKFDAVVRVIVLTVPDDLRGQRAIPAGPFVFTVRPADGGPPQEYRYRLDGDSRRDGPTTISRFIPDGHEGTMTFRPGDEVLASVSYRAGGVEFELLWSDGRSRVYTFDRLLRQPEVRRRDSPFAGERAIGVRLVLLPETGWPAVPPLLP